MSENHYQTLGLEPTAELERIKQAYRQQIRKYHPDTFASRRKQLQRLSDDAGLKALEIEIGSAKLMTQRINAAYAILSDVEARAKYDQQLSKERQVKEENRRYRQRMRDSDDGRRTVKSRPHRPSKAQDAFPIAMLFVLFILLFLGSALLSNTIFRGEPSMYVASTQVAGEGEVTMNDLQATTNSRQATRISRATHAALPTPTPRSAEDNERLGDSMMELTQYHLAIESYSAALLVVQDPRLYTKRGLAYSESYFAGRETHAGLAFDDFNQAIALDSSYALAYRGRGWLFYMMWQSDKSPINAEAARRDFEAYLELVETDAEIEAALQNLNE
jgi:curved DNA-binding protein CbpA